MTTKFRCSKCAQTIKIGPEALGKRGKCPGCQEVIRIPTAEQFAAAAAKQKQAKPAPVPAAAEPDPFGEELSSSGESIWGDLDLGDLDMAGSGSTTLAAPPVKAKAKKGRGGKRGGDIEAVRTGQKLVIFGILLYLIGIVLNVVSGGEPPLSVVAAVGVLAAVVLGMIGIIRLTGGLGYSTPSRVMLCLLMILPLIGLITLLMLNSKATKKLRANGYQVGLFGA